MYQGISNTFVPITEHQRHFPKPKPYVSTVTKTCHINSPYANILKRSASFFNQTTEKPKSNTKSEMAKTSNKQ